MFSIISRKLKGNVKTREYVQLLTPNDFDNFLRNGVFEIPVKVTRVHVVPRMKSIFEGEMNPNAKGIGHIGWRPGHILTAQKRKAFERLQAENPDEWQRLIASNSLVVSDATAQYFLEDYDVLSAMCRGHDGKNPNHVIRFVFNPITQHSTIQYKHFDFEDVWRPTLRFDPSLGTWINDDSVTYSWFKEGTDFCKLISATPKVTVTPKSAYSRVVDELEKCKTTMANFTPEVMAAWIEYFDLLESIRQCATPTLPYLPPKALAEAALPTRLGMIAAQKGPSPHLYLTSVVGALDRETLVASDHVTARAWSSSMKEMRYTPEFGGLIKAKVKHSVHLMTHCLTHIQLASTNAEFSFRPNPWFNSTAKGGGKQVSLKSENHCHCWQQFHSLFQVTHLTAYLSKYLNSKQNQVCSATLTIKATSMIAHWVVHCSQHFNSLFQVTHLTAYLSNLNSEQNQVCSVTLTTKATSMFAHWVVRVTLFKIMV